VGKADGCNAVFIHDSFYFRRRTVDKLQAGLSGPPVGHYAEWRHDSGGLALALVWDDSVWLKKCCRQGLWRLFSKSGSTGRTVFAAERLQRRNTRRLYKCRSEERRVGKECRSRW